MKRRKPPTPTAGAHHNETIRQLQKALAVTRCIGIATEYGDDDALDLADALAALVLILETTAATLDRREAAT